MKEVYRNFYNTWFTSKRIIFDVENRETKEASPNGSESNQKGMPLEEARKKVQDITHGVIHGELSKGPLNSSYNQLALAAKQIGDETLRALDQNDIDIKRVFEYGTAVMGLRVNVDTYNRSLAGMGVGDHFHFDDLGFVNDALNVLEASVGKLKAIPESDTIPPMLKAKGLALLPLAEALVTTYTEKRNGMKKFVDENLARSEKAVNAIEKHQPSMNADGSAEAQNPDPLGRNWEEKQTPKPDLSLTLTTCDKLQVQLSTLKAMHQDLISSVNFTSTRNDLKIKYLSTLEDLIGRTQKCLDEIQKDFPEEGSRERWNSFLALPAQIDEAKRQNPPNQQAINALTLTLNRERIFFRSYAQKEDGENDNLVRAAVARLKTDAVPDLDDINHLKGKIASLKFSSDLATELDPGKAVAIQKEIARLQGVIEEAEPKFIAAAPVAFREKYRAYSEYKQLLSQPDYQRLLDQYNAVLTKKNQGLYDPGVGESLLKDLKQKIEVITAGRDLDQMASDLQLSSSIVNSQNIDAKIGARKAPNMVDLSNLATVAKPLENYLARYGIEKYNDPQTIAASEALQQIRARQDIVILTLNNPDLRKKWDAFVRAEKLLHETRKHLAERIKGQEDFDKKMNEEVAKLRSQDPGKTEQDYRSAILSKNPDLEKEFAALWEDRKNAEKAQGEAEEALEHSRPKNQQNLNDMA